MACILAIGIALRSSGLDTEAWALKDNESMVTYHEFLKKFRKHEFVPAIGSSEEIENEHSMQPDPFVLPQARPKTPPVRPVVKSPNRKTKVPKISLNLTGILWDANSPYAVIGDEIVSPGSRIGAYTVREISRDHVVLATSTKQIVLKMPEGL